MMAAVLASPASAMAKVGAAIMIFFAVIAIINEILECRALTARRPRQEEGGRNYIFA